MTEQGFKIEVGNLSLNGCESCPLAQWINDRVTDLPPSENLGMFNFLSSIKHYAIELNGLKREHSPVDHGEQFRVDDDVVLGILLRAGFTLEDAELAIPEFMACVDCPGAISASSDTFVNGEIRER